MDNMRTFHAGDLVRHFKRETLDLTKPENRTRYLYRILGVATHSETREALMIYQALYDDMGLFARPYDMFMEKWIMRSIRTSSSTIASKKQTIASYDAIAL